MNEIRDEMNKLAAELAAAREERVRLDARIAGLQAQYDSYARAAAQPPATAASNGSSHSNGSSLRHCTVDDAIITVLVEAAPDDVQLHDIERRMAGRDKEVPGGISVNLSALKRAGRVRSTRRGYYAAP